MRTTIIAVGKSGEFDAAWCAEYLKRMPGEVIVKEVTAPKNLPSTAAQKAETERLLHLIPPKAYVVLLDEQGRDLGSREFAAKMQAWQDRSVSDLIFLIGGADGVTDEVRGRADFMLGFGKPTWPHLLVRVMLIEQIYRARQINAGHPYHRD